MRPTGQRPVLVGAQLAPADAVNRLDLAFDDEFNESSLELQVWGTQYHWGSAVNQ